MNQGQALWIKGHYEVQDLFSTVSVCTLSATMDGVCVSRAGKPDQVIGWDEVACLRDWLTEMLRKTDLTEGIPV